MNNLRNEFIGAIRLKNVAYVADPCSYKERIDNIESGIYSCRINMLEYEPIITDLIAIHEDFITADYEEEKLDRQISVDSGIAGIFSYDLCNEYNTKEKIDQLIEAIRDELDPLLNLEQAGTLYGECFFSRSGEGDGLFDIYVKRTPMGEIVSIRINFIKTETCEELRY